VSPERTPGGRESRRFCSAEGNKDRRDGGSVTDLSRSYNDVFWNSGSEVSPTLRPWVPYAERVHYGPYRRHPSR
jgi:hypothetical protein